MKSTIISAAMILIWLSGASALADHYHSSYTNGYGNRYTASDDLPHHHYITGNLGFLAPGANLLSMSANNVSTTNSLYNSGLFAVGGDYDYMLKKTFSIGGFFRYYNVSTSVPNNNTTVQAQETLFTVGPQVKAYLPVADWLPFVTTGFAYMAPGYQVTANSNTTNFSISGSLGMMIGAGILYPFSDSFSLGIQTMRMIGLSNVVNGVLTDDYMIQGRFGL